MIAYYNEFDKDAAAWLRELIKQGLIAPGDVDERNIEDVRPGDLAGYTQCHFFAGIGGWSYALRLAGWPDDRPVWTGSCPCQPFSAAGKGAGFADERHLWPAFQHLIAQRRPSVVIGEQVASSLTDAWFDLVHADLENLGYAFGCVPFPSAGIGAPHVRDRAYWLGILADANNAGLEGWRVPAERAAELPAGAGGVAGGLAYAAGGRREHEPGGAGVRKPQVRHKPVPEFGDLFPSHASAAGPTDGFWRNADWIRCRDDRWRPVEPGTFPLADGLPARVVRLRGYGNAINAQAAAAFVRAFSASAEAMTEAA